MNVAVVIPAYQPGKALLDLVRTLSAQDFGAIVLVDDGSSVACRQIFEEAEALPLVRVLRHPHNLGKGAALKTAIAFVQSNFAHFDGIVTADADGQHDPDDVVRLASALTRQPHCLILGARSFQGLVPLRSRFGNTLTRWVMRLALGRKLSDTQTGLRAIPAVLWPHLLGIEANGYEFEMEMLLAAHRLDVPLAEEPIRTIYDVGNPSSHFNPLIDSMKIYFVLLRFASVSVLTAVLDNVVFYLAFRQTGHILASQIAGRVLAVAFNYSMVRRSVFHTDRRHLAALPRYLMLVLLSGAASYGGIRLFSSRLGIHPVAAKLAIETALFFVNFAVQRLLIFPSHTDAERTQPRRQWIPWLLLFVLTAVVVIEIYGFAVGRLFAQSIWFPVGIRRLIRYACLFVEFGLPILLLVPWLFTGTAALLILAGTLIAAPAALLAVGFFLLSCWTLGSKLIRGAAAPYAALLGAAIYIFLMTGLARLPWNYPWVWAAILAIPILLDLRRAAQGLTGILTRIRRSPLSGASERAAFALLVFVVGMHWLVALKPETSADGLAVHLAIPVNIAAHHRLTFEPDRFLWSVMPMGADWTFSIAYLLGGETAPRLLNFAMLLVLLALLYPMVRRSVSQSVAFLLLAAFAATPLVQLVTGSLFVENLLAALLVGTVGALWQYGESRQDRFFLLAAVLAASALAVKLGAVAALAILLPFAIFEAWRNHLRPAVAGFALLLFIAAAAPPYAVAWSKTGDPVFPYLVRKFPSPLLDPTVVLRDPRFREPLTWHTPFDLTFHTGRYFEGQDGSFGFQYLFLIPLALVALLVVRRRDTAAAAITALGAMTLVLASEPNVRYLYAELPLLCIPAAALLDWLRPRQPWLARTTITLLVCSIALDIYFMPSSGWYHKDFYSQLVFAQNGKERFLETEAPDRDVVLHFNRRHPGASVLLMGDNDLADPLGDAYAPNWHQYAAWQQFENAADGRQMLGLLRKWNVQYVIGQTSNPANQAPGMRDILNHCLVHEYDNHWAWLARVDPDCRE